jgi:hypothetical protein
VRNVVINRVRLSDEQVARIEQTFRTRLLDGAYWYDKMCGAWGVQGGPAAAMLPAGLELGAGPLRADASAGNSGVFINDRQLQLGEVMALQQLLGAVMPGRYWMDGVGNCGYEGNPMPVVNLMQLAAARQMQAAGAGMGPMYGGNFHRNDNLGTACGSDGRTSYVSGPGWSVVVGE